MIYMETGSLDPTWNLAFEEYCLTELTQFPEIMLLWQNDNAIIVGRYQNAEKEVNVEAAKALGVKVVRRSTGGGTVYHDMGNLTTPSSCRSMIPRVPIFPLSPGPS